MKAKITALIIIVIALFLTLSFTSNGLETVNAEVREVKEIKVEENLTVEKIEEFKDENLLSYDIEQLKFLIEDYRRKQWEANEVVESAKKLGWPSNSDPIRSANYEWLNAQRAIEVYTERYEVLYKEKGLERWEQKKAEFPSATHVWLYMKELGWNDYVCAGIMGNLMAEVGGQTLNLQYTLCGKNYYGMCQWSRGYSKIWGAGLTEQCDFLRDTIQYEIDTFGKLYAKGFNFNSFLNMSNEKEAALAFAKSYERCNSKYYAIRQKNATKAYDYFVNN
jgi:hypothetical protein